MIRAIVTLAAGAVAGALVVLTYLASSSGIAPPIEQELTRLSPETIAGDQQRLESALALIEPESRTANDPTRLETEIFRLAGEPRSPQQQLRLKTLIAQLAAIDFLRAVRFVRDSGLEQSHLVDIYLRWAEVAPDKALAAFGEISNPGTLRTISLLLLEKLGTTPQSIDMLASALPESERNGLQMSALVDLVERDPHSALNSALSIEDRALREVAISGIAYRWGDLDPRAAVNQLSLITEDIPRRTFFNNVVTRWARIDPSAAFDYAIGAEEDLLLASSFALRTIANRIPARVITEIDYVPPRLRSQISSYAAGVLAEQDPFTAISTADALPAGNLRESLILQAVNQYAATDPNMAASWVQSRQLTPRTRSQAAVAISRVDPAVGASLGDVR